MKVISLIQPWATLIMLCEKRFETRSWATNYRGPLAIHASKKIDKEACRHPVIQMTLNEHGIYVMDELPIGKILGMVDLKDCHPIHEDHSGSSALLSPDGYPTWWIGKDSKEFIFGDYSHGRFAWEVPVIEVYKEPIPAIGQLGLWNWEGVNTNESKY